MNLHTRRLRTLSALAAGALAVKTVMAACSAAADALRDNRLDLPFALLYLSDREQRRATLMQAIHLPEHSVLAPVSIMLTPADQDAWPVARVLHSQRTELADLHSLWPHHVLASLPSDLAQDSAFDSGLDSSRDPIRQAMLLPLFVSGQAQSLGVLICAINPAIPLDQHYRDFLSLLAAQVSCALGLARSAEADQQQADLLQELTQARQAAEVANRTKDEFLAMLGHELRNPLTPILTAVHLMRLRGAGVDKECQVIERQARHLVRLVDDLLDVSRVARGKIKLQKKRLEVAEIVAKAVETVSPLLEQRQHQLLLALPSQGLAVHADPDRMPQVLANLLTNACKYTQQRGEIRVSARRDGPEILIEVADNGIGIKAAMQPFVFDMFVQESQALDRSGGGLGLGLAIVRSLTELHGGSVQVASNGPGSGTLFTVRLPALAEDSMPPLLSLPAADMGLPPRVVHACNILVVDDNQDAAHILAELLTLHGHQVQVAFDGPSALEMASRFIPRIALLDIGLPIMDGYEVAEHLRRMPELAGIGLLALTGYGQPGDRLRSTQAGIDHHLIKPVDIELLEQLISSMLSPAAAAGTLPQNQASLG